MPGTTKTLDDEFAAFSNGRGRVRCYGCKLPPELRDWVDDKLRGNAPTMAVAEFLTARGHKISASAMQNHRRNHVA